jgi:hypothetical protein
MLIVALVLAVIGLAALVTAVVTSNELVAWVCIAASVLGVILLIVDAIRERQSRAPIDGAVAAPAQEPEEHEEPVESATADVVAYSEEETADSTYSTFDADYPDESLEEEVAAEDHPEEVVSDDPESDTPDDDEPELPEPAEEAAVHTVDEDELADASDELDDLDAEGDEDGAPADEPDKR